MILIAKISFGWAKPKNDQNEVRHTAWVLYRANFANGRYGVLGIKLTPTL